MDLRLYLTEPTYMLVSRPILRQDLLVNQIWKYSKYFFLCCSLPCIPIIAASTSGAHSILYASFSGVCGPCCNPLRPVKVIVLSCYGAHVASVASHFGAHYLDGEPF